MDKHIVLLLASILCISMPVALVQATGFEFSDSEEVLFEETLSSPSYSVGSSPPASSGEGSAGTESTSGEGGGEGGEGEGGGRRGAGEGDTRTGGGDIVLVPSAPASEHLSTKTVTRRSIPSVFDRVDFAVTSDLLVQAKGKSSVPQGKAHRGIFDSVMFDVPSFFRLVDDTDFSELSLEATLIDFQALLHASHWYSLGFLFVQIVIIVVITFLYREIRNIYRLIAAASHSVPNAKLPSRAIHSRARSTGKLRRNRTNTER